MLACALNGAWAQDSSTPPATGDVPPDASAAACARVRPGQCGRLPSARIRHSRVWICRRWSRTAAPLSYLQPGATFSESAESNAGSVLGGGGVSSVTRALGSLTLKRLWSHYNLALDYIGGAGLLQHCRPRFHIAAADGYRSEDHLEAGTVIAARQLQLSARRQLRRVVWFAGIGGSRVAREVRLSAGFGEAVLWEIWDWRRAFMNVSVVDVSESLSPKSSLTAAGGIRLHPFLRNRPDGQFVYRQFADFGPSGIQPRSDARMPDGAGLWIPGIRFFGTGNGVSFPCVSGDVRTPDFGTDGLPAGSGPQIHFHRHAKCRVQRSHDYASVVHSCSGTPLTAMTDKDHESGSCGAGSSALQVSQNIDGSAIISASRPAARACLPGRKATLLSFDVQTAPVARVGLRFVDIGICDQ